MGVHLVVLAIGQVDRLRMRIGRIADQRAVFVDQRNLHEGVALHDAFLDRGDQIEIVGRLLILVFDEAGDLVDLMDRLDGVLFERRREDRGGGHRFMCRRFTLD